MTKIKSETYRKRGASGCASSETSDPAQAHERLAGLPRLLPIHVKFGDPVVVLFGVDEHLLQRPSALVFRSRDVGVPEIPRIRIQADPLVLHVVGFQYLLQAFGRPGLAVRILWRREVAQSLIEVRVDQA